MKRVLVALLVGILGYIVTAIIGGALVATDSEGLVKLGHFLEDVAFLVGLGAAIWFYIAGDSFFTRNP